MRMWKMRMTSELKTFSIERDKQYIIPFIHEAQKKEKDLCFLSFAVEPAGIYENKR